MLNIIRLKTKESRKDIRLSFSIYSRVPTPWLTLAYAGLRFYPPVKSKICSFLSLPLQSQRRSSIVSPPTLNLLYAHEVLSIVLCPKSTKLVRYPDSFHSVRSQIRRLSCSSQTNSLAHPGLRFCWSFCCCRRFLSRFRCCLCCRFFFCFFLS